MFHKIDFRNLQKILFMLLGDKYHIFNFECKKLKKLELWLTKLQLLVPVM